MPLKLKNGLTIGFYGTHFALWLVVVTIFGGSFLGSRAVLNNQISEASLTVGSRSSGSSVYQKLTIANNGLAAINGQPIDANLAVLDDGLELRHKLLDEPGFGIELYRLEIHLPKPIDPSKLKIQPLLIHSAFSPEPEVDRLDNQTYLVTIESVDSRAVYTIVVGLPKGYLDLSWWQYYVARVGDSLAVWLAVAAALPVMSVLVMLILIWRVYRLNAKVSSTHQKLPADRLPRRLPPAVVGLLVHGRITERDIAATLIDLAWRGFLEIFIGDNRFSFVKRTKLDRARLNELQLADRKTSATLDHLLPYERALLSKIFYPKQPISHDTDFLFRVGHRLFSQKIARMYIGVYEYSYQEGFFTTNPATVHYRYVSLGLIIFFLGLVGFAADAIFFSGPTLLFWVGALASGLVITQLGGLVSPLSIKGRLERTHWLRFRDYLRRNDLVEFGTINQRQFEQYLSYAIVMGVEKEWLARFSEAPFVVPEWFYSPEPPATLEEFSQRLFDLIAKTSQLLVGVKDPSVN